MLKISHAVKKEAEGSYYTIGFDVPSGIEKIIVSYNYNRISSSFKNIVDLGLEDADGRFLGWSDGGT